jgi:hypothetical protein
MFLSISTNKDKLPTEFPQKGAALMKGMYLLHVFSENSKTTLNKIMYKI